VIKLGDKRNQQHSSENQQRATEKLVGGSLIRCLGRLDKPANKEQNGQKCQSEGFQATRPLLFDV